ncbi:cytochrome c oxidase subunit II [Paenibacillus hamazuiensis]|uniref:cytochrome c oxidase subunit II n=1 Tax=Paenibacillus hamazuiensis TaxID=2936508 RepID=UPI00200FEA9A|nr:cytochrome c oxidase subunit II [Paenibacillus hamazuiensis]
MSRWQKLWRFIPLFSVMMFLLTGCGDDTLSTLKPRGPVARDQLFLMKLSLGIMILVVLVVFVIYIYVLLRYRKKKGDNTVPKQVEGSHVLEIIWTVIPIVLLVVLAVPTVAYTFKLSENPKNDKDAVHVKVTAHAFWWQFEYPDLGIATAQDLVIPKGKKIAFELTSADVLHSFWVPSLGGKIDTNPGSNTNVLYLQADEVDVFKGKCAELCGASHALMDFKVISMEQSDFDKWVNKMKTPITVPAEAKQGEQLFKDNCMACHAVTPTGLGAGPNLNGFASRTMVAGILPHTDESLQKWIKDPQSQKPGNKMPSFGATLKDDQINSIIKYLDTLK